MICRIIHSQHARLGAGSGPGPLISMTLSPTFRDPFDLENVCSAAAEIGRNCFLCPQHFRESKGSSGLARKIAWGVAILKTSWHRL